MDKVSVVDQTAVDLVGQVNQRLGPIGALRQHLDLDDFGDRDGDFYLDEPLDLLLGCES